MTLFSGSQKRRKSRDYYKSSEMVVTDFSHNWSNNSNDLICYSSEKLSKPNLALFNLNLPNQTDGKKE
jgi:hypothetical protein